MGELIGTSDWLIVETLGIASGAAPSVVSQGASKRNFASLVRRTGRDRRLGAAMVHSVDRVVAAGTPVDDVVHLPDGTVAAVRALPILSPTSAEVFGVQLWSGPGPMPPPRTVGSFEFDFRTRTTKQSPELERDILSMAGVPGQDRALPEIWKYFTEFDQHDDYFAFVQDVQDNKASPAQPFAAEIQQRANDGRDRRVHMTVRARNRSDDERKIVGLVHDISDAAPTASTFGREFARTAARLAVDEQCAIGHLELTTGLILEWIRSPEGQFAPWATEVPTFHPRSVSVYQRTLRAMVAGTLTRVDLDVMIRFSESPDWLPTDVTLTAVGRADRERGLTVHQGLVQVRPAAPDVLLW